ncbi:hypothetical protein BC943DRAFT_361991 [Umbelopsis sp. AD052]|nr:hypothetical protein BC943DRAFT_361991 [Umbelopsis sp. AD052]
MSTSFSPGCGNNTYTDIPSPIAGWDTCYVSYVITEGNCVMTADKVPVPCQCDASDRCTSSSSVGDAPQTLICNGQPTPYPPVDGPNATISGSCTYKKAGSTSTPNTVTVTTGGTTSAGISLTKSNMLIATSLVLCAVIGSF